jgi:hypothetical protein
MTSSILSRRALCLTILVLVAPPASQAQRLSPITLEANIGASYGGSSGAFGPSGGFSGDALVGYRIPTNALGPFVLAISGSGQAPGVHAVSCDVVPGGSCTNGFPIFWILSALAGWETETGGARVLVGPAVAISSSHRVGAGQVRLDLARPLSTRVSLLVSGRFAYIPQYRNDVFRLAALGVGVRLR